MYTPCAPGGVCGGFEVGIEFKGKIKKGAGCDARALFVRLCLGVLALHRIPEGFDR